MSPPALASPSAERPSSAPPGGGTYRPRDPGASALVQVLERHLDAFSERCGTDGDEHAPPAFVFEALRAVAGCGDLARGFARLACDRCRAPRVVPYSCKTALCPSCGGRRMAALAAYAVDRLLPHVPYRQWVLSLPFTLRHAVAFDPTLLNDVFACVTRALLRCVSSLGAEHGVCGQAAGVLHVQRFQDGAQVNPHGHYVLSDAVFVSEGPTPGEPGTRARAVVTRAPTRAELQAVVDRIEHDVVRLLERRARAPDSPEVRRLAALLARLASAAPCAETRLPDAAAGQAPRRAPAPLCVRSALGVDLHAGVTVPARDRDALERLLRYLARPPLALARLSLRGNGNVVVSLKRPWARGTVALEYAPLAFIARLAALVPPPRFVAARALGAIAPHAKLRALVVPTPPTSTPERPTAPPRPKRLGWAELMKRVLSIDPRDCPCGGRFRLVATIDDPTVIEAVAAALIASGHLPPHRAPRGPPRRATRTEAPATRQTRQKTPRRPRQPRDNDRS